MLDLGLYLNKRQKAKRHLFQTFDSISDSKHASSEGIPFFYLKLKYMTMLPCC